jgi:hypothetical protein
VRQGYCTLNKPDSAETFENLEGLELVVVWSGVMEWRLQNHEIEKKLICSNTDYRWARGGSVVEAVRYKPAGHGFDSRCCWWIFSLT